MARCSRGLPMSAEPLASHPCNECGEPGTIYRLRDGRNYPSCDRCLRIDEVSDMLRGAVVWTAAAWAEAARVRAAAEKEKEEKRAVAEIVLLRPVVLSRQRFAHRPGAVMSYTLPNGRQATPKQERERMKLLEARRTCPECIRLSREAVRKSDYSFGACQCPEHRS